MQWSSITLLKKKITSTTLALEQRNSKSEEQYEFVDKKRRKTTTIVLSYLFHVAGMQYVIASDEVMGSQVTLCQLISSLGLRCVPVQMCSLSFENKIKSFLLFMLRIFCCSNVLSRLVVRRGNKVLIGS